MLQLDCPAQFQLTLTLEESGGIRLATLPQALFGHHWLCRGRGALSGARASHALTSCFSSLLHPPFRVNGAGSDPPFEPKSIEDLRMTIPRLVRFRGVVDYLVFAAYVSK